MGRTENEVNDISKNIVEETLGVTGEPDLSSIVEGLRSLAVPISSLRPDPRNARKHGKANMTAIEDSLKKFGQQKPIVVSADGTILAGNGTVEAAKKIGWTHVAAVRSNLSGSDATGFAIADNRTAELAEWDKVELATLLSEMPKECAIGFTDREMSQILDSLGGGEEDEVPEAPSIPKIKFGDLWIMGEHRLLCGDSRIDKDVDRLFGDRMADMLLTDPPYGVSYVGKTADAMVIQNDALSEDDLAVMLDLIFGNAHRKSRAGAYWYASVPARTIMVVFLQDWKKRSILRQTLCWVKDSIVLGRSEYHYQHEPILFGWVPGDRHKNPDRTRSSVWAFDRPKRSKEHPTMKPIALWENAIKDGSIAGEIVYDPCCGSGTTLIASENLGRKCFCIEIDPKYAEVIVVRWQNATGKKAVREDGVCFDDLA